MGDSTLDNFFDTDTNDLLSGLDAGMDPMLSSTSLSADQGETSLVYASPGGFSDQTFNQQIMGSPGGNLTSQSNVQQVPTAVPLQRQLVPQQLYIANVSAGQQPQNYIFTTVNTPSSHQGTPPIRIVRLPAQSAGGQSMVRLVATSQSPTLRTSSQPLRLQSPAQVSAILTAAQQDTGAAVVAAQGSLTTAQQTRMVYLPASFSGTPQSPIAGRALVPASPPQQQTGNILLGAGKAYVTMQTGAQGMTLIMPCSSSSAVIGGSAAAGVAQTAGSKSAAAVQQPQQVAIVPGTASSDTNAACQADLDQLQQQLKQLTGSGGGRKSQAVQLQIQDLQEKVRVLKGQLQNAVSTAPGNSRRPRRVAVSQQQNAATAIGTQAQAPQSATAPLALANVAQSGSGQLLAAAAKDVRAQQAREKSIQIAQEAIEKARAAGVISVPGVTLPVVPATIPSTVDAAALSSPAVGDKNSAKKASAKLKTSVAKNKKKIITASTARPGRRKRKQPDSSDMSDLDLSPPQSPVSQEDLTMKRRSGRVTKRTKYVDELELDITDDEDKDDDRDDERGESLSGHDVDIMEAGTPEPDTVTVDRILGMRKGKQPQAARKDHPGYLHAEAEAPSALNSLVAEESESDEYFVKYKNYSYLHCEWKTAAELEKGDKRIRSKVKRYRLKRLQQSAFFPEPDEDEMFNPEYTEVERVLCEARAPDPDTPGKEVVHYLVKWRQLPYEDSTWELEQDVAQCKIEQFKLLCEMPSDSEQEVIARPEASEWTRLDINRAYNNGNTLRAYQLEGVNWLTYCYYKGQNCILADEMGLGKTIQSIAFLQEIYDYGIHGPFLVVAPLSTIANWLREFEQWTDMNAIVYHGSATSRRMLQEYEMYYRDEEASPLADVYKFHAMITTYEVIIQDQEILSQIGWRCCIIDEAHRLKNKHSKLLENLRLFDLEHKVLLSGTPLQNNVQELFSLLNFLEPSRFQSSDVFLSEFGDLKTEAQVERLKALLKPMMLRRLKEDVEKNLAPKEETIIEVELTAVQKQYYRAILEKNFTFISKSSHSTSLPSLMNTMMELRKCCNHPYLVNGAEERILEEAREQHAMAVAAKGGAAAGLSPVMDAEHLLNVMVQASGKLVLLDKLLPKLKAGNHKVLIFSQMIRVLDILEDYLIQRKYCYERLDGRIRGNLRQEAIDRFSKLDSDRFVFLLCTRAGGLGINLTAADTCIIYDSDWNPQNDLQAQARCHRIGQEKAVKVYRLICRKTYEREMFDRASKKLGLDKAVLQSMSAKENSSQAPLGKKEVEDLLKRGAYGALMDDDHAGDQFCEEDIDLILQRRTQVITIESVGKGSTFAKASFSSSGTVDIDINDPEFWQKWAKRAELDTEKSKKKNELVIEEPRQRKQTARYGNQNAMMEELPSELESSTESEQDEKLQRPTSGARRGGRRGRRRADDDSDTDALPPPGAFTRPECFKVEKHLLVYGWGRWRDIVAHAKFKRHLSEEDVEIIARAMLHYSLKHYKGDERIKAFIWDLITPSEDGSTKDIKNHSGLAAPVPRGRKRRLDKKDPNTANVISVDEKIAKCDHVPEAVLVDSGYRRHLTRHANKLLLRVRLLYYLKQEILGDQASKLFEGLPVSELEMTALPPTDGELPAAWWDEEADRCLLVGIYKHGYEKYNAMRGDPDLCFLSKCGPPDGQALAQEQAAADDDGPAADEDEMEKSLKVEDDDDDAGSTHSKKSSVAASEVTHSSSAMILANGKLPFPSTSDLNTRLRRLITSYQRNNKRRQDQHDKLQLRYERSQAAMRGRNVERVERKTRWTRKEESDFYRVVSTFGVERDRHSGKYRWDTFRRLGNLGKKEDDQLTEYFLAFYHMCQRVCRRLTPHDEARAPTSTMIVEAVTEVQAGRCLARIELLNRIREDILWHPRLTEHLKLCQPGGAEMPSWWQCGEHDKDLLIGAAKHGLARTDYHILSDRKLCFHAIVENLMRKVMKLDDVHRTASVIDQFVTESDSAASVAQVNSAAVTNGGVSHSAMQGTSCEKDRGTVANAAAADAAAAAALISDKATTAGSSQDVHENSSDEDIPGGIARDEEKKGAADADKDKAYSTVNDILGGADIDAEEPSVSMSDNAAETHPAEQGEQHRILPSIQWPKDKVVCQRLEQVCHCIEYGEWPSTASSARKLAALGYDSSMAVVDSPGGTPKPAIPLDEYNIVDNEESAGLKITFAKQRQRKPQHYSRIDAEADRITKLRDGLESSASSPHGGPSVTVLEAEEYCDFKPQKRRGRKVTMEKMSAADAEALRSSEGVAATSSESMLSLRKSQADLDIPISVVNIEDGSRLSGDEAPRLRDLDRWLLEHPGYTVDSPHHEGAIVRQKRRRVDPDLLDLNALTGDENISVINRETGKKITGAKAPPLKHLATWLEKNSMFDVDPKWSAVVRAKGKLPENLQSRVRSPIDKKKRQPRASSSGLSNSAAAAAAAASLNAMMAPAASAALMASLQNYPMHLAAAAAYNGLAMGLPLSGLYGINVPSPSAASTNDDSDLPAESSTSAAAVAAVPTHSAFPQYMCNPLLYGSMLAAHGVGRPSRQPPSSLAAYAHPGVLNGLVNSMMGGGEDGAEAHEIAASLLHGNPSLSLADPGSSGGAPWGKAQRKDKKAAGGSASATELQSFKVRRERSHVPRSPSADGGRQWKHGGHDYAEMPQDLSMKKSAADQRPLATSKSREAAASLSLASADSAASLSNRTQGGREEDSDDDKDESTGVLAEDSDESM